MSFRHVVVDGSNIATEGRSLPSLSQLDEAVRAFLQEFPDTEITVVVDASFGHRIAEEDRAAFEEARDHGELVSPPAGAIGRGDAFLLRIAEKMGATVLSNDSFQEFHGEHDWLFSAGRLIGGVPVPGVGWIFTPRTPVRGPKSREAVRDAKRTRARIGSKDASQPMPIPKTPPPGRPPKAGKPATGAPEQVGPGRAGRGKAVKGGHGAPETVEDAIAEATEEAVEPARGSRRRRRRRPASVAAEPVNEPLTFINFVADHHLGSEVEGVVDSFTSHGAFVVIGDTRCYIPLSALGDPPPRSAREVLHKGERRTFVVQAFDPQRRGVELALPGFAHVAGSPTTETVEAEIEGAEQSATGETAADAPPRRRRGRSAANQTPGETAVPPVTEPAADQAAAVKRAGAAKKAGTAKKAGASKKAGAGRRTPPEKATTPDTTVDSTRTERPNDDSSMIKPTGATQNHGRMNETALKAARPRKMAPAKKAAAKKATAGKPASVTPPAKKAAAPTKKAAATPIDGAATATKAPASKAPAAKGPAKKAAAEKAPANKVAAPAKKAPAAKAATPAKKAAAEKAPAKKAAAEKAPAKKVAAPAKKAATPTKATAKKEAPAKKAPAKKAASPTKATANNAPAKKAANPTKATAKKEAPAKKAGAQKAAGATKAPAAKAPGRRPR